MDRPTRLGRNERLRLKARKERSEQKVENKEVKRERLRKQKQITG
jgi:hypothetical protein